MLKVKYPNSLFSGAAGCVVPSLSQVQVELLKVKYPNSLLFWCCGSIIIPSTSRIVESKVPTVHFVGSLGFSCTIIIQCTSRELLKVKVSQQFTFSGAAGCVVPSLSQVQVEVLKENPNSLLFWCCRFSGSIIIPSTS
jgi:hypothetical protein